jgi:hypothetical protein
MQPCYTQIFARTQRPTQALGALKDLDAYMFPHTSAGTLICERTSEAIDVRILVQVSSGISRNVGRRPAVLAIAGDNSAGFWCGLFDGGDVPCFEHNRLTGPRDFTRSPADPGQVVKLCDIFDVDDRVDEVYSALTGPGYDTAVERHAALALALGLPHWSPGIGYSRIMEGDLPAEAGMPAKPPRSLKDLRSAAEWLDTIEASDSKEWFQEVCQRAFGFLMEELGFRRQLPEPPEPYRVFYRSQNLIVVVEGLSYGARTRLCLIDSKWRLLDFTGLVERRDPKLLDLCRLASGQREQIPIFAEALQTCAADVLAGNLTEIAHTGSPRRGFSFDTFFSKVEGEHYLAQIRRSAGVAHG